MKEPKFKSFNYTIGMFGTSIPINMIKDLCCHLLRGQTGVDHSPVVACPAGIHIY